MNRKLIAKRKLFALAALLLVIAALYGTAAAAEQRILSGKLTRLHVIANSDSDADQALKLKVRDAVLTAAGSSPSPDLNLLREAAYNIIESEGYDYPVTVELGSEVYPARYYDTFALPAGSYNSLRVTIGSGVGQNWWCVLFPPLCVSAAEDFEQTALNAGLTGEEIELMSEQDGFIVRFRVLEILQNLSALFGGGAR